MSRTFPTYDLAEIQRLIAEGEVVLTRAAIVGASRLQLNKTQIIECITSLDGGAFYKTMPALRAPGLIQDVYTCLFEGLEVYLKLQIDSDGRAIVVSFKRDESSGPR